MSSSLRDQLLQLGLVNKAQVNEAERQQQRRERPPQRADRPPHPQHQRPQPRGAPGQSQPSQRPPQRPSQAVQRPQPPRPNPPSPAQAAQAAKIARDLAISQKQRVKAEKRARHAEIKQLIEQHVVVRPIEGEAYNFLDDKKIRQIRIDPAQRAMLSRGELLVLRFDGRYHLLPPEIAARVRERDERIFVHSGAEAASAAPSEAAATVDDAYAAFVVPDDLIW